MSKKELTPEAQDTAEVSSDTEVVGVTEVVSPGLTEEAISRGFDKWMTARLSNSPLSRNTEAWNLLRKEKTSLIDFIQKEVQ